MTQALRFLGQGWPFPLKPGLKKRLDYISGEEKIRQSIWLILSTSPGERQMRPTFGCGIHELLFQPNTPLLHSMIKVRVQESLTRWEPRVDIVDVRVEAPPEAKNYLLIYIDYRVRANNAFFNLVYPFFINEGVG